ncbi:MAG: hypothetical protein IPI46_00145 [Bacteroidetes bacterium]|nr:hypothetical protein [Bacteroidota bacterium]
MRLSITKKLSVLAIALAGVCIFSLSSCAEEKAAETPTEEAAPAPAPVAEPAPAATEAAPAEGTVDSTAATRPTEVAKPPTK